MQVILHTGAHETDDDRLLKCLLRNKESFSQKGIAVPGPGKYRHLLGDTIKAMETAEPSEDARDVLIDAILDDEMADRVLMSNAYFFGARAYAIGSSGFYPKAAERAAQLRRLFMRDQVEFFMAIRNPATFLPTILDNIPEKRRAEILGSIDPRSLRWSDLLVKLRMAAPDVPITVWCNEDTPLIWAQIIREMAGLDHGQKVSGGFDLLATIMSKDGMKRFRAYLHEHPSMTEIQKRRVISAFLDKYAIEDAVEEELDLPGWTEDLVDELTDLYDEDVFRIQRIPGVQLISP